VDGLRKIRKAADVSADIRTQVGSVIILSIYLGNRCDILR